MPRKGNVDDIVDKAVDNAIEKIKRMVVEIAPDIAYDIAEKIQIQYDNCIDLFYNDFDPVYYDRTNSTYKASYGEDGVSDLFVAQETDTGVLIEAGIIVDSSLLGSPYKDPTDYVFTRTWEYGIHGTLAMGVGPVPKQIMDKWFDQFKNGEYRIIVNKHLQRIGLTSTKRR